MITYLFFFRLRRVKNLISCTCFCNVANISFHFIFFEKGGSLNFLDLEPGYSNDSKKWCAAHLVIIVAAYNCWLKLYEDKVTAWLKVNWGAWVLVLTGVVVLMCSCTRCLSPPRRVNGNRQIKTKLWLRYSRPASHPGSEIISSRLMQKPLELCLLGQNFLLNLRKFPSANGRSISSSFGKDYVLARYTQTYQDWANKCLNKHVS